MRSSARLFSWGLLPQTWAAPLALTLNLCLSSHIMLISFSARGPLPLPDQQPCGHKEMVTTAWLSSFTEPRKPGGQCWPSFTAIGVSCPPLGLCPSCA